MAVTRNIFREMPKNFPEELVEVLIDHEDVRIERIVSQGHASPNGFWYDQEQHEWVIVLRGQAELLIENDEAPLHLKPGDFVNIPAHTKHRVQWTAADEPTLWLAIFY